MGGWDYYCGICGCPLGTPYWDEEEQAEMAANAEDNDDSSAGGEYDPAILSSTEDPRLEWLSKFKVVTEIPSYYNKSAPEGWISGPASEDMYGSAQVSLPEEDSHIPTFGEAFFGLSMYHGYDDDPFSVPFHDQCHSLLLRYMQKSKLDADVFYETVKALSEDGNSCLELDYGDAGECMEQYWCTMRGTEWLIMSPLDVSDLEAFFKDPPKLDPEETDSQVEMRGPGQHDPFSKLAPEIMTNILSSLNLKSMGSFRLASRVARNIELGNHFWKQKVLGDMPWLFDIPEEAKKSSVLDWKRIYGRMLHASRAPSKGVIHGLANRRRIWKHMLPQIVPLYLENLAHRQEARAGEPESFSNARSTESAVLVEPEPNDAKSSTVALLQTPHSIETTSVDIAVCFNKNNEISTLKATQTGTQIEAYDTTNVHRFEEVSIPDKSWITGFIFTTRGERRRPVGIEILLTEGEPRKLGDTGEGGKRLVHVPKDHFIVGFRLHTSKKEDLLCRLGLLYHQDWRAGSGSHRVWDYNNHNDELYNIHATNYLWHNQLPPPGLQATKSYQGYWCYEMQSETSPFEALVFPKHYTELEDLVAIAADVQFGGFELRFATLPTRAIGPKRQAMKVLEIDGKGGERILTVHVCVHHIPTSLRIVTNRGRQLIIGQPDGREVRLPGGWAEGQQCATYGIFGFWKNRNFAQGGSMDSVGALYLDSHIHSPPEVSRQAGGLLWETAAPPTGVEASGPVIGTWEKARANMSHEVNVPEDCNVLSWLDFGRPISDMRVTMSHSLDTNQLPLVGIQLTYADGQQEKASIGPNEFYPPPSSGSTSSGQPWCWCQLAVSKVSEELEQAPHYQHHEWNIGGKKLSALRVFVATPDRVGGKLSMENAKGKTATAIQFVAEDGAQSPVWGYWQRTGEGEDVQEIKFGQGNGEAVGVKFFVGANGRSVTREDYPVQAFQALIESTDKSQS